MTDEQKRKFWEWLRDYQAPAPCYLAWETTGLEVDVANYGLHVMPIDYEIQWFADKAILEDKSHAIRVLDSEFVLEDILDAEFIGSQPTLSTIKFYVNGELQVEGTDYTIDYLTGLITFPNLNFGK